MRKISILIDGMLSGTGIRDVVNGGYMTSGEIGLSGDLRDRISLWLSAYEDAHFHQFNDIIITKALDREGVEIAKAVRAELPQADVGYFSSANMNEIKF